MTLKSKLIFSIKLYLKQVGNIASQLSLANWLFSLFNFAFISLLMLFIVHEHDGKQSARELAIGLDAMFWGFLLVPFVSVAVGLSIRWIVKKLGYEIGSELWPEVEI